MIYINFIIHKPPVNIQKIRRSNGANINIPNLTLFDQYVVCTRIPNSHSLQKRNFTIHLYAADGIAVCVINVVVFTVGQSWDGALCCTGRSC